MYQILENEQVMKQEKGDTYELWKPIGSLYQIKLTETEIDKTYTWTKFSIDTGTWEDDPTCERIMTINETEFTPINGIVKLLK